MKRKTKNVIAVSLAVVLVIALFGWYYYPILMAKWLFYNNESIRAYLKLTPVRINSLPVPPKEWTDLVAGDLMLKLPMSRYSKVDGKETYLLFASDTGSVLVYDIVPSRDFLKMIKESKLKYPSVSYQEELGILNSTPADMSFFNSRRKNSTAASNQVLKAIAIPIYGIGKIVAVNARTLKALCIISEKRENGYHATAHVYSQNEATSISVMLKGYQDRSLLEAELLAILGGINMPDHMPDIDRVSRDISGIVAKFGKT